MVDIRITPFSPARVLSLHLQEGVEQVALRQAVRQHIGDTQVLQDGPTTALAFAWDPAPRPIADAPLPAPLRAVTDVSHAWEGLRLSGRDAAGFVAHQLHQEIPQNPHPQGIGLRGLRTRIAQVPCCAVTCDDEPDAVRLLAPRSYIDWLEAWLRAAARLHTPH
jgi:sarcosine oxidase gamma subunit